MTFHPDDRAAYIEHLEGELAEARSLLVQWEEHVVPENLLVVEVAAETSVHLDG